MKTQRKISNTLASLSRTLLSASAIVAFLFALNPAQAVLVRESLIVNVPTGVLGQPGIGTAEGWGNPPGTGGPTVTNGAGSLIGTNLGLIASEGDRVFIGTVSNLQTRNQFVESGTFPPSAETNVYYSFLYKFNDPSKVEDGKVLVRVNRADSGTGSRQHWDLLARNVGGYVQLGLAKGGSSTLTNWATTNIAAGQTIFVVVRQQIIPGPQNDVYYLWINPPASSFGASEDSLPPPSVTIGEDPADGAEDTSSKGPGRFVLGSGADTEFDELRIGTTWADVTPWFGMCVSASIVSPPTNVTVAAGLSYTFRVAAFGTGRQYQWQVSTNNGVSWENLPGAITDRYTTPLLRAADNGKQYRVIVTTPCDGQSVTSSVATLTVYEPTPTQVGIVCHDIFEEFELRDDEPVNETNSVWRASTSGSFESYPGPGVTATPASGSASLWIGYFTDLNSPPVHLGIGREIKVTLPFTPVSYNEFTNNGGVRFGLFDYYDGGTRVTSDGFSGSAGNGISVRGYLLNLNFGPTFNDNTPFEIYARYNLDSPILCGAISDFQSLGSGPLPGTYSNAPAFQAGTQYTLEFRVLRYAENATRITTSISGGGTNWTWSVTDTTYAYPRFDAFAIRTPMRETSCDQFFIPEFKVEVVEVPIVTNVPPFRLTEARLVSSGQLKLTWESVPGVRYDILSRDSLTTGGWVTNATVVATGTVTSYTNTVSGAESYFKISVPLPQLPAP